MLVTYLMLKLSKAHVMHVRYKMKNEPLVIHTFESPPLRTFTMTSITVSCIPRALIRLGCW